MKESLVWRAIVAAVVTSGMEFDEMFKAICLCIENYQMSVFSESRTEGE